MHSLRQELSYAIRGLIKSPLFSVTAIVSLALGIGANTAIFSLLYQVLLRALPIRAPQEIVMLDAPGPNQGRVEGDHTFSYPMYRDFRDQNNVFSGVIGNYRFPASMTYGNATDRLRGELVSGNYFEVLGVRPILGRAFTQDEDRTPGAHPLAILSYGFWQRRFGGDRSILGQTVEVNSTPLTIIGVAPPGFEGLDIGNASEVFIPVTMKRQMTPGYDGLNERRYMWLNVFARVNPGESRAQAEAGINVLFHQILQMEVKDIKYRFPSFPKRFTGKHLYLRDGSRGNSDLREHFSTPLLVLMGFVGLVLLIACANIANLLMARGASRQKEIAIRLALGASRARIIRQLLVESVVLACCGGALGILLAVWLSSALLRMVPSTPHELVLSSSLDLRVLLFTVGISVATGLVFGLLPALQSTRPQLAPTLKSEATSVAGGAAHNRARRALVVAQVAISLLLVIGAGLFARSLFNLRTLNPGFRPDHLLQFSVDPTLNGYDDAREIAFAQNLRDSIAAIPAVKSVSAAEIAPVSGNDAQATMVFEGYTLKEGEDMNPHYNPVGAGYFSTLGIPVLTGREFSDHDGPGAPLVGVINQNSADNWFHGQNPIGRHFGFVGRGGKADIEIVGVVANTKHADLRSDMPRMVYIPYMQDKNIGQLNFFARTSQDPAALGSQVRAQVSRLDSHLPVFDIRTMDTQLDQSLYTERMIAMLSVIFGAVAALLAAVGLYGVVAYSVARRTSEIGIRMALGASGGNVLWLVMKEVVWMAAVGVAIALPLALGLNRLVKSQLYGLAANDPLTLVAATIVLGMIAALSGAIPAFRASRIDPMRALRYE